jgi:hypothetical protein
MEAWGWGLAVFLTCVGALHCWSARVLEEVIFYRDAALILILALLCAGLGWMGTW